MPKDSPFFSIIVPVYNASCWLDRCVKSVIEQSYSNWQLILINDGSTDDSGIICDKWAQNNGKISVLHTKNHGVASARNQGIQIAQGDFVCSRCR